MLRKNHLLKDHLGSIKVRVDENGEVVGYDDYCPFGMVMNGRSGSTGTEEGYKYTGKERDIETGFDYFGARYYDSKIGRWLSVDPLTEKYPSLSTYNYVNNNPLINLDPDGKAIWRNGEGYIDGFRAKELVIQQMKNVFQGRKASIDFIRKNENVKDFFVDIKDSFTKMSYTQGGQYSKYDIRFGDLTLKISDNFTKPEFNVNTYHSFEELDTENIKVKTWLGNNGQEFVSLDIGSKETGATVITYTNTVGNVNKLLENSSRQLVRQVKKVEKKINGRVQEVEVVTYTLR